VEHLKGASLGWAPSLPTNIRLGWKGLPRANTQAYQIILNNGHKKFYSTGPRPHHYIFLLSRNSRLVRLLLSVTHLFSKKERFSSKSDVCKQDRSVVCHSNRDVITSEISGTMTLSITTLDVMEKSQHSPEGYFTVLLCHNVQRHCVECHYAECCYA
jgi:hypothetical protein